MTLSLLLGRKYAQTRIGAVFLDATLNEDHIYTARATSFPVEDGRNITDHIINEPESLSITGVVSDTPLSLLSTFNRSIDAFNRLVRIHTNKELITVVTGIKVYTNMCITSLQIPKNVRTGQSLTFVIELQKLFLDTSVRLSMDENNPFAKTSDKIPREIVSDTNKYPFHGSQANTALKDQASSTVEVGIQELLPIPNTIKPNIIGNISNFSEFV